MGIENLNKTLKIDIDRNKRSGTKNSHRKIRKLKTQKIAKHVIEGMVNMDIELTERNISKQTGIPETTVKRVINSKEFDEYLANAGLDRCEAAEMLVNKLKEHYALPAGKDKGFKDLMDMVLKSMGAYTTKQEITLDKTPESLTLVRDLIKQDDGSYGDTEQSE